MGDIEQDDRLMKQLVKRVGCVAVSVDYRLPPEHPFPAPVEDCYAGLQWLFAHAGDLGVDPSRIAIGGASAGGGLAAGLALLTRDRGEVQVAFQLLIYPMIDDRNITPASYAITDPRVWHRESNRLGWKAYLGRDGGGDDVSPYAAARATDLTNLPSAYIPVGALDLFIDENIEYAQHLIQAGVPTELHVYPGAFHGFDVFAPSAAVSKQFKTERDQQRDPEQQERQPGRARCVRFGNIVDQAVAGEDQPGDQQQHEQQSRKSSRLAVEMWTRGRLRGMQACFGGGCHQDRLFWLNQRWREAPWSDRPVTVT